MQQQSCLLKRYLKLSFSSSSYSGDSIHSKHLSFHPSLSISHFSLWGPMKGLNENMFIRSSVIWSDLICSRSWHRWKFDVRVMSQSGQLIDWSELESSSCSFGWSFSQGLRSERLQFPSSCWIRYFGDDSVSIKTLRAGILSWLDLPQSLV